MYLQKPIEITILNNVNKDVTDFLSKSFLPESILVPINDSNNLDALSEYPFFKGKKFDPNFTSVFICKDFTCSLPLQTLDEIKQTLSKSIIN